MAASSASKPFLSNHHIDDYFAGAYYLQTKPKYPIDPTPSSRSLNPKCPYS